jgi:hypothetical protein
MIHQVTIILPMNRVTSGVVLMAKSKSSANTIAKQIRDKKTEKVYIYDAIYPSFSKCAVGLLFLFVEDLSCAC